MERIRFNWKFYCLDLIILGEFNFAAPKISLLFRSLSVFYRNVLGGIYNNPNFIDNSESVNIILIGNESIEEID